MDEGVQIDCVINSTRLFKHNSLMPMDYGLYDCCYERKNRTPMNDDADYDRKQLSPLITGCTATTSIDLQQRRGNRSKHKRIPNAKCGIALSPHSCHSQFSILDAVVHHSGSVCYFNSDNEQHFVFYCLLEEMDKRA